MLLFFCSTLFAFTRDSHTEPMHAPIALLDYINHQVQFSVVFRHLGSDMVEVGYRISWPVEAIGDFRLAGAAAIIFLT